MWLRSINYAWKSWSMADPAYSFAMLIIYRKGKILYLCTDIDETWYIASYGQNKVVHAQNAYIQCFSWQQTYILFPHDNQME
jgi:hypothetical protein